MRKVIEEDDRQAADEDAQQALLAPEPSNDFESTYAEPPTVVVQVAK